MTSTVGIDLHHNANLNHPLVASSFLKDKFGLNTFPKAIFLHCAPDPNLALQGKKNRCQKLSITYLSHHN